LRQIQQSLDDLVERAHSHVLTRADLSDGTFSISNMGMYGVSRFTAILNPPQVAILAVGQVARQFVPDANDQPVARSIMTLVLTVDHRWIDGAQAAEFLSHLRVLLEEPALLAV
jgi:pyruvate dehydrogenase E2 component (dihydrolipoamide acetyltransferase)